MWVLYAVKPMKHRKNEWNRLICIFTNLQQIYFRWIQKAKMKVDPANACRLSLSLYIFSFCTWCSGYSFARITVCSGKIIIIMVGQVQSITNAFSAKWMDFNRMQHTHLHLFSSLKRKKTKNTSSINPLALCVRAVLVCVHNKTSKKAENNSYSCFKA